MSNTKWLNNIARLLKSRDGKYFLVFARPTDKNKKPIGDNPFPLVINEGDTLQAKLKKDDLQGLVNNGKLSQEQADRICETVKFEFSKGPARTNRPAKSTSDDGVNF
jgi:hypothetical protein